MYKVFGTDDRYINAVLDPQSVHLKGSFYHFTCSLHNMHVFVSAGRRCYFGEENAVARRETFDLKNCDEEDAVVHYRFTMVFFQYKLCFLSSQQKN